MAIPRHRYPYTVLYIETDSTLLDVNVHPTKQEIRISKEADLRKLIKEAISSALRSNNLIINQTITTKKVEEVKPVQTFFDYSTLIKDKEEQLLTNEEVIQETLKLDVKETIKKDYEVIGQIHGTYIIAQSKDGFILIHLPIQQSHIL